MLLGRAERKAGIFYRLHLGSEEVEDGLSLLDLLQDPDRKFEYLAKVLISAGRSIRALHDAGVYHSDLNLGNLLAVNRAGEDGFPPVKVIDLDKSVSAGSLPGRARTANLARLYRHALKNGLHRRVDLKPLWRSFLKGYALDERDISSLEKEVDRRLRRSLFLHRLSWWIQGK
jgi:3-deoxy-D-manno-octulosonic acid kinase